MASMIRYPFQDETDELLELRHRQLRYAKLTVDYPVFIDTRCETWRQRIARRLAEALAKVSKEPK
jgi:hypothetical protein